MQFVHEVVNARNNSGTTVLHVAAGWHGVEQQVQIIELLLSYGADITARSDQALRKELAKIPQVRAVQFFFNYIYSEKHV
jgi:ankyrin repeat protein